ncbi:hypothetical protein ILYODFUR_000938 [Ilyodon furcidens]|uniref:Uncharacterized protein n=1 Tax=Ilyodon furcidens TaxID=33524 RepID=A0ABV0ST95_9TELE
MFIHPRMSDSAVAMRLTAYSNGNTELLKGPSSPWIYYSPHRAIPMCNITHHLEETSCLGLHLPNTYIHTYASTCFLTSASLTCNILLTITSTPGSPTRHFSICTCSTTVLNWGLQISLTMNKTSGLPTLLVSCSVMGIWGYYT